MLECCRYRKKPDQYVISFMVRFLLYDVEMISSHRIILFTCIKNRGVEIFNIDRIRFNLRFQTESIPLIVSMTIFTMFIFDKNLLRKTVHMDSQK